ncbi:MAG: putative serine/threonine protein kinase [Gemmatimonadetes bacterium]|nr:putative serine/threonine protein kinase [Gemmatimonadota bacterium]
MFDTEQIAAQLAPRYIVERELGGGGMSLVLLARDERLGRTVVVKVLSPRLFTGLDTERFRREIALLAQLQHPNIVPILDAGDLAGVPFFTMPYVAGESARSLIAAVKDHGPPLPVGVVVAILRDVTRALAYAHAHDVIHRDIKPDNILLSGGAAAVADFGIARAVASARPREARETQAMRLTSTGMSVGTPTYMAPEQAAADPHADHRVDIYALGVTAYELLSGHPPFVADSPQALLKAHLVEMPPALGEQRDDVPESLEDLVMSCLEKDPALRPPTASAVLERLETLASGANPAIHSSGSRAVKRRRSRRRLLAGTIVAIALMVIAGVAAGRRHPAAVERVAGDVVAIVPFRVSSSSQQLAYLTEGMVDLLAAELPGVSGEGGVRAADPAHVLGAWRQQFGTQQEPVDSARLIQFARSVGAGQLVTGEVTGTPLRVVISASLFSTTSGIRVARASVEGVPDSLPWLVDRLAFTLLSGAANAGDDRRIGSLTNSLPALRAYLGGQVALRRADGITATRQFRAALAADSMFAQAGLGLHLSAIWFGQSNDASEGLVAAWRARERLSPVDRLQFLALAGPNYPLPSSTVEQLAARVAYRDAAQQRADAWVAWADDLYHYGAALGIANARAQALDGFRRAGALDSSNSTVGSHTVSLAMVQGDTAFATRVMQWSVAAGSGDAHRRYLWDRAAILGDADARREVLDSLDALPLSGTSWHGITLATYSGYGVELAERAIAAMIGHAVTEGESRNAHRVAYELALSTGRPQRARQQIAMAYADTGDYNHHVLTLRDAMVGVGDSSAAVVGPSMAALTEAERRPVTDSASRALRHSVVRVLEPWRLAHGDSSRTEWSLRTLVQDAHEQKLDGDVEFLGELAVIRTLRAAIRGNAAALPEARELARLLLRFDFQHAHPGRTTYATLVASRALVAAGDSAGALNVVGRHGEWNGNTYAYLLQARLEEARLARRAGDQARARDAYAHVARLLVSSEPSWAAVKREAESFVGGAVRP